MLVNLHENGLRHKDDRPRHVGSRENDEDRLDSTLLVIHYLPIEVQLDLGQQVLNLISQPNCQRGELCGVEKDYHPILPTERIGCITTFDLSYSSFNSRQIAPKVENLNKNAEQGQPN